MSNKIGDLIRRQRESMGLTQADLAKQLGYGYGNFIGMLETGKAKFPLPRAVDYAKVLGIDPPKFLKMIFKEYYPEMLPYLTFEAPPKKGE